MHNKESACYFLKIRSTEDSYSFVFSMFKRYQGYCCRGDPFISYPAEKKAESRATLLHIKYRLVPSQYWILKHAEVGSAFLSFIYRVNTYMPRALLEPGREEDVLDSMSGNFWNMWQ